MVVVAVVLVVVSMLRGNEMGARGVLLCVCVCVCCLCEMLKVMLLMPNSMHVRIYV
jgi:hypothetical protein